jgi:hypothetical protein
MDDLTDVNNEMAFNNVRNGTWDLETFQEWCEERATEVRNDAFYYASLAGTY